MKVSNPYAKPCTREEYDAAVYARKHTDHILRMLDFTALSDEDKEGWVQRYNHWCEKCDNDRHDYTLGELQDMYCGPFSVRPECFDIDNMYVCD